jgi:hypothetical protein
MTPLSFFRLALILPFGLPLLALPFGVNALTAVLMLSMFFGGIQYAVFAAAMVVILGRRETNERMLSLCFWAPFLFLPLLLGGWAASTTLRGYELHWGDLLPLTVYDLLLGYFYVGLCSAVYLGLKRSRWIREVQKR